MAGREPAAGGWNPQKLAETVKKFNRDALQNSQIKAELNKPRKSQAKQVSKLERERRAREAVAAALPAARTAEELAALQQRAELAHRVRTIVKLLEVRVPSGSGGWARAAGRGGGPVPTADFFSFSAPSTPTPAQQDHKPRTVEDIRLELGIDLREDKTLLDLLRQNSRIALDPERRQIRYRAEHDISSRDELLALVLRSPPLQEESIANAYKGVKEDIEALRREGLIWALFNAERRQRVLFPRDPEVEIAVDEDLQAMWRSVALPEDAKVLTTAAS